MLPKRWQPPNRIRETVNTMPKMKTNRAAAKRFKFTASGRARRRKAFHNHILTKKSMNRKRNMRHGIMVAEADLKEVKALMPYG